MKKYYAFVWLLLSILVSQKSQAQCPGCIINTSCTASPLAPTICPAVLPNGTAMQYYDQNITIFLPHNFTDQGSGMNVDLTEVDILSITGMPIGMNFQTSASPTNIFYPSSNPPTSEYACGKICGTPLIAGNYTVTVFVKVYVNVVSLGGISQTQNSSFELPITILPATTSNNGFSIANPNGCAPHTTTLSANHHSNGNPNYHYLWNFGNGNMSMMENPPAQTYANPGSFVVTLQTQIDTLPYYFSALTINAAPDCNDSPWGAPDYYFNLKQGSTTVYSSSYIGDTYAPVTFAIPSIQLSNANYSLETYDSDGGMAGADDHCGTFTIPGNTAGTFTLTAGTTVITYTVIHPLLTYNDVDTIHVFASPVISNLSILPNDTICEDDSITFNVTATNADLYQWYSDTNAIFGATYSTFSTTTSGTYLVEVTNIHGCRSYTTPKKVLVVDNPTKPNIWITGNMLNTNATGVSLQWYCNDTLIQNAVNQTYTITKSGNYYVIGKNYFGCFTSSDTIAATYISGISENTIDNLQVLPNPSNGTFEISFVANKSNQVSIRIIDMVGHSVYSQVLASTTGVFNQSVNLENTQNGIYVLELITGNTKSVSKIVIH